MEGVDVYFLTKQMGTSVRMIEDHYGAVHLSPTTVKADSAELPSVSPIPPYGELSQSGETCQPLTVLSDTRLFRGLGIRAA